MTRKEYIADYYVRNKEEIKVRKQEWYQLNKPRIALQQKCYQNKNETKLKVKRKVRYQKNKDKLKIYLIGWHARNPTYSKEWYQKYKLHMNSIKMGIGFFKSTS